MLVLGAVEAAPGRVQYCDQALQAVAKDLEELVIGVLADGDIQRIAAVVVYSVERGWTWRARRTRGTWLALTVQFDAVPVANAAAPIITWATDLVVTHALVEALRRRRRDVAPLLTHQSALRETPAAPPHIVAHIEGLLGLWPGGRLVPLQERLGLGLLEGARPPVPLAQVERFEAQIEAPLPKALRAILQQTDGFLVGGWEFLGTRSRRLPHGRGCFWLLAESTSLSRGIGLLEGDPHGRLHSYDLCEGTLEPLPAGFIDALREVVNGGAAGP